MNEIEAAEAVTYANQIDPFVQSNDATVEVWASALVSEPAQRVRWAIKTYYGKHQANGEQRQPITPATIRRMITSEIQRMESKGRALEPPRNRVRHPQTFRQRNPDLWDKHFAAGRAAYQAENEKDKD